MDVGGAEAGEGRLHVTTGHGQGQLPVGNVFDAIDTTGEDAVVHPRFPRDGTQQRRVGRFALEGQTQDAPRYVSEIIALCCFSLLPLFTNRNLKRAMLHDIYIP